MFTDMILYLGPLWTAFLVGIIIGWAWKPKWASQEKQKLVSAVSKPLVLSLPSLPSNSPMSRLKSFGSAPCLNSLKIQSQACESWVSNNGTHEKSPSVSLSLSQYDNSSTCSTSELNEGLSSVVTEEDLKHLWQLVEMRDGGPSWIPMMDRSAPNMSYQAWRRDPKTGPPQYRSKTVFEDATPKMVRDFFWDDEFRPKWDDMLAYSATLEECRTTGTTVVQWIRKFPFFCSDREYIIGRRIWELDGSYYCVTKGVSWPSIPRRDKPRRVDLYYSSWYIRAVESRRSQLTACEVLLFHHEDMGIPWEIAKLGIRHGMWGTVKKIEPGLRAVKARTSPSRLVGAPDPWIWAQPLQGLPATRRAHWPINPNCPFEIQGSGAPTSLEGEVRALTRAYQNERASLAPLSPPASMAQINTKISTEYLGSLESNEDLSRSDIAATSENPLAKNISRALIFGGVIVLACSLDCGLLSKAFIFGTGRRLANKGKRVTECSETGSSF
ncbi:hypothetical protein DITRI_Ditri07aG0104700 [Diplodiscus trichospermus]